MKKLGSIIVCFIQVTRHADEAKSKIVVNLFFLFLFIPNIESRQITTERAWNF